ncbi:MAG TPA: UDP-N-acetylmuramoyl-L-alanine--D-glutamate ligase [Deltaproteobacteria bacterium]|uniref:UDP-N-acetylmuramoylalanine--D-glutamate ligase n=1 Tax=Candidatus Daviesbacteria bacterium GW2011_GWF2_38_6 TaxID=1618432 RepID=A0A0G0KKM3_9BACT|nr:MAG: UDP-N-acetylmuramoylalanine-D-glutamate ligase [Candidatus Daviesbacteria bacterium GW2011_GWF2_38_6]HBQ20743.1 UDP-N-acetylmuramoyl-L-alanine--D-glutamate ligase [Deltaproteobacteria bacterium]
MIQLKGKKIVVVGLARSGVSVAQFLASRGAKVTVTDIKTKTELQPYLKLLGSYKKIKYELGRHPIKTLLSNDIFIVSPGVWITNPLIEQAKKKNKKIMSEIEFAYHFIKEPIVAITGTNGKTTTTMMVGQFLQNAKKKAFVGGNIGNALTNILLTKEEYQYVVSEVSSFQLETIETFHPKIALVLNLTPDHLDRHGSMENYRKIKGRIFENQKGTDYLILNAQDDLIRTYAEETKAKVLYFTKGNLAHGQEGIYYKDNRFYLKTKDWHEQYLTDQIKLKGDHNKENFMAALLAAKILKCSPESIQQTLNSFQGVAHRLEYVKTRGYVDFYNDSKATNVYSVIRSLESFDKPLILIMGGRDKDANFELLRPLVQKKVKNLILLGEAKEKINRAVGDYTETFIVGTLEEAIFMAYQKSRAGDVILFSPGCASFDMFKNYEHRGDTFKELLRDL